MKTNLPGSKARRWRAFGLSIEKKLATLINDLHLFASVLIAKWMMRRELKRREVRQAEAGYGAKKRKLLVALRRKISEQRSKR